MRRIHDQYRDFAAESIAAINAAADAPGIAPAFGASSSSPLWRSVVHTDARAIAAVGPGVDDSSSRTRDLSTLFQPPVEIMFQGTYADVRPWLLLLLA